MNSGGETKLRPSACAKYTKMLSVDPTGMPLDVDRTRAMLSRYGCSALVSASRCLVK